MSAVTVGLDARGTIWFGVVGVAATAVYFVVAMAGSAVGMAAYVSSLAAYGVASLLSYCGHRVLTFRSTAAHSKTAPRFAALTALQYGLALAVPVLVTEAAGFSPLVSYLVVCVVAPLTSLLVMSRFVFIGEGGPAQADPWGQS